MSELSPEARALVEAARGGDEPTDGDRSRVRAAVFAAVGLPAADAGAEPAGGASSAGVGVAAGSGVVLKVLGALVVAGALAFGGWWALGGSDSDEAETDEVAAIADSPEPEPEPEPEADTEPAPEPAPATATELDTDTEPEPEPEPEADTEPAPAPEPKRDTVATPRPPATNEAATDADSLREETLLVARAQAALNRGDAKAALTAAAEHRRRFRHGAMVPERSAVEILALCELGQLDRAKARAARFLARWPKVPAAQRVRGSCGAE